MTTKEAYTHTHEAAIDFLVQALCETYTQLTGKRVDDRLRDDFFQAVRFK